MLATADAALIIGDNALFQPLESAVRKVDLGEAWTTLTGLPFVYAFWAGRPGVLDAAQRENAAGCPRRRRGAAGRDCRGLLSRSPERQAVAARYLRIILSTILERMSAPGSKLFFRYAAEAGVVPAAGPLNFYQWTIEALAGKVRAGGRVDAPKRSSSIAAPRRRSSASSPTAFAPASTPACRDLHHRPERELHEHLRRQVQLLRVLSSGRSSEGYVLGFDELFRKIDETIAVGGVQLLLQGGHNPDLPLKWYEDLFRAVKERYRLSNCTRCRPPEVIPPLADVAVARAPGDRSADGGRPRQHPWRRRRDPRGTACVSCCIATARPPPMSGST